MQPVEPLFDAFATAALDRAMPVPEGVCAHHGGTVDRRFAIYRNNVAASLIGVLRSQFPAIERLVGEAYFKALAREYITREPPISPVLAAYGDGFAPFLAAFPPLAAFPYLADVARIERAQVKAYHAVDADPLRLAALRDAGEEVAVCLHPSAFIIRSQWRALDIWRTSRGGEEAGGFAAQGAQIALVVRPALQVVTVELDAATALFAETLLTPQPLSTALAAVWNRHGIDAAGAALGALASHSALTAHPPEERRKP